MEFNQNYQPRSLTIDPSVQQQEHLRPIMNPSPRGAKDVVSQRMRFMDDFIQSDKPVTHAKLNAMVREHDVPAVFETDRRKQYD